MIKILKEYQLNEMAAGRKDVAADLEEHTMPTMSAICQVYLFPGTQYDNHWRNEVWEKLHSVKVFRGTHKLPSAEFIYKNTFGTDKIYIKQVVQYTIDKEYELTPREDIDYDFLEDVTDKYFQWLAAVLSKDRVVGLQDVRLKLKELGL